MSGHIYIGPYLHCVNPQVRHTIKTPVCDNSSCRYYKWEDHTLRKFCGECGTILTGFAERKRIDDKIVVSDQLKELINDTLYKHQIFDRDKNKGLEPPEMFGDDFWMPAKKVGKAHFEFDFWRDIIPQTRIDEIEKFQAIYGDLLCQLKHLYGNGEVKWGIVTVVD